MTIFKATLFIYGKVLVKVFTALLCLKTTFLDFQ